MKPSWLGGSLTCDIFSKKADFCLEVNLKFKKWWRHYLLLSHRQKQNSEAGRLIVGTPSPFPVLSFSKSLVCRCVLFIYTIFFSVICVLQEELNFIASKVQIHNLLSVLCIFVCVCMISNQSTSKKPDYVSDLSKFDALLHRTHIKIILVLRYQGSTFIEP